MDESQISLLVGIIKIAGNISSDAVDGIDGFATAEQVKTETEKNVDSIKRLLRSLIDKGR